MGGGRGWWEIIYYLKHLGTPTCCIKHFQGPPYSIRNIWDTPNQPLSPNVFLVPVSLRKQPFLQGTQRRRARRNGCFRRLLPCKFVYLWIIKNVSLLLLASVIHPINRCSCYTRDPEFSRYVLFAQIEWRGVIEEMLYILYDMIEKIIKSLYYLYFLKRVFGWEKITAYICSTYSILTIRY